MAENEEQFIAEKIKNIAERQYKVQSKKEVLPRTFSFKDQNLKWDDSNKEYQESYQMQKQAKLALGD